MLTADTILADATCHSQPTISRMT